MLKCESCPATSPTAFTAFYQSSRFVEIVGRDFLVPDFLLMRVLTSNSFEDPIREELFSVERLELYAGELAAEHRLAPKPQRGPLLLPRLEDNGRKLVGVYRELATAIRNDRSISPAAEWLVDNFHIVEEQLREIRQDLPKGYYRQLPKLENGQFAGYPRVYALANGLIAHTDSRLDEETVGRFIKAYQQVSPLSIGELWAIAITLRVALVENLRRLAVRIVTARSAREMADELADSLLETAGRQPDRLIEELEEAVARTTGLDRAFVVQLTQRLRDQDPEVWPALDWLEKELSLDALTTDRVVHVEHQRQAATQVTVGNIITSMRLLSTLDWREFFERVSTIDPVLAKDPANAYSEMDFDTRDRYRHVIEKIARRTFAPEHEVARAALGLAQRSFEASPHDLRKGHVGYYLIDRGMRELERLTNYRLPLNERLWRLILKRPTIGYLGSIAVLTLLIIWACLYYTNGAGASAFELAAIALLLLVPASDLALSAVNLDVTLIFKPTPLPKMEAASPLPDTARTLVVIPTIFSDEETVRSLVEKLEVHYLANNDNNIYFALLGDFADADEQDQPEDDRLLQVASTQIEELNARYSKDHSRSRFYLFHRLRTWNPLEERWIGWERKRGKLEEFNRLLRGAKDTGYIVATADSQFLSTIRYVITLDSDTWLPRDAARRLIGTALHPLNRPLLDSASKRVSQGYGIFQPRVSMTLTSSSRSRFASIFSGHTGVDPYTTAVSDVYQDLFGEGIYTGKGLYDVDAFEGALSGRVPENYLLSHDLFESLFARTALVTDVELLDDYPSHYDSYAKRQHRWTRGDWQLGPWLLPWVKDASGNRVGNTLPLIARWKILDNLRRSLVAPTMLLWLAAAWTVLPGSPAVWTLLLLGILAFPVYAHVTNALLIHPRGIPWTSHFWSVWGDTRTKTAQLVLSLTLLAHQAYLQSHAIVLTMYRKLISKKKLLEWVAASQAESMSAHDLRAFWHLMWPTELLVLGIAAMCSLIRPDALALATPFLVTWVASPLIAFLVSRQSLVEEESLSTGDERIARLIARRTWRLFEEFVGSDDNWLAPDNFQEDPRPIVAHRTSPTDIGLLLLSTAAARDFGYVGLLEFAERLELTFGTMDKLDRFNGHFLNWYDTRTLSPLTPQYVSTVDSGNLAGHLLALKQACIEVVEHPMFDSRLIEGTLDTLSLMRDQLGSIGAVRQSTGVVTLRQLRGEIERCAGSLSVEPPKTVSGWLALVHSVTTRVGEVEDIASALSHEHGSGQFDQLLVWTRSLMHQLRQHRRDIAALTPWALAVASRIGAHVEGCSPEIGSEWSKLLTSLDEVPAINEIAGRSERACEEFEALRPRVAGCSGPGREKTLRGLDNLIADCRHAAETAAGLLTRFSELARRSEETMREMDFGFLFDEQKKVFIIGYDVSNGRSDNSFYDLLASEARLASFVAIAKGDVQQEHWFHLGRQLTSVDGSRALVSWSGTMFEYLMPLLVMRTYDGTLLDQTHHAVVARQIEYGKERGVPWGISECAYNARDLQFNYQYGPFGVPGLGLKRGLSDELVVSPYSTALAAMVEPAAAIENLRRLIREGALGRYGFYEAIDYTKERLQPEQKSALIKAFMVHHQGMTLISLDNLLNENVMQNRFHSDPMVQATELLLQERIPRGGEVASPRMEEVMSDGFRRRTNAPDPRHYDSADLPTPRTQLLSNGNYSVVMTTAGSGYSVCGGIAVTRWREDVTRDNWGSYIYLRDVRSGAVWSAGHHPAPGNPQSYEVSLAEDKAEFRRSDAGIQTHTEVIVSPEDNTELRRVSVTNNTTRVRDIELTSYMELVLAPHAADYAHPAFSNLFVETEFVVAENALFATRRKRTASEEPVWAFHVAISDGDQVGALQYETDRARFLGRGHSVSNPIAVIEGRPLSNTVGPVLDPIFSLRHRVRLSPRQTTRVTFATGVAPSREEAMRLADKYHNPYSFGREGGLAWTKAQVEMRHLQIDADEAHLFQRLAGRLLYSDPSLRPRSHVLALNTKDQSGLWAYGISGDLPIALVRISEEDDLNMVHQLLRGHEYLRMKGLVFDLVILNDHPPSYIQSLQDELQRLIRTSGSQALLDKPGGVYLRRADIMPDADRILLHTVARVVCVASRGPLEEQLVRRPIEVELPPKLVARSPSRKYPEPPLSAPGLTFFNGLGGFTEAGREYVIVLSEGQWTPAPWINVIANPHDFGFQVSGSGAGFTWSVNSRENRLTPWSNDPVSDPVGEALYLRDEERGLVSDAAADSRTANLYGHAWTGLYEVSTRKSWHPAGAADVCAARCIGQGFAAEAAKSNGEKETNLGYQLRRIGSWYRAEQDGSVHYH
jgi:cyclic beta-1,2-glucan synthetase